jgi:hypothetical protein
MFLRLHRIIDGPGIGNPCQPCLYEHTHCSIEECTRPHGFLIDEEEMAGLVRTRQPKFSAVEP